MNVSPVSLITCSYSGDLDVCRLLCASIDRFTPQGVTHQLYVPRHEIPLFADLATPRRTIGAQEDLLPWWFRKAPLPGPKWRARLGLPRRNVYLTPFSPPVRGWIAQQMTKIAATLRAPTEVVAHIDSDNVLIRPLAPARLFPDGKVRFHASVDTLGLETHKPWYAAATRLLGLPDTNVYTADYIDQFVVWRRSVVEAMTARISATTGRDWTIALARTPHFAEYVLYGVFVERVMGLEAAGLSKQTRSLCHSRWSGRIAGPDEETAFVDALSPDQVACVIQSTIPMSLEERKRVFQRVKARAAEQDARLNA